MYSHIIRWGYDCADDGQLLNQFMWDGGKLRFALVCWTINACNADTYGALGRDNPSPGLVLTGKKCLLRLSMSALAYMLQFFFINLVTGFFQILAPVSSCLKNSKFHSGWSRLICIVGFVRANIHSYQAQPEKARQL